MVRVNVHERKKRRNHEHRKLNIAPNLRAPNGHCFTVGYQWPAGHFTFRWRQWTLLADLAEPNTRELGRLEGRLELTAQGESTAREDLERERARVEEERRRADAERERAEELRRELEAERSKGFWARLFGG